jgi:hypothetical protein
MATERFLQFFVRTRELWQDWPVLLADDGVGSRFHALLEDEELEVVFREFRAAHDLSE